MVLSIDFDINKRLKHVDKYNKIFITQKMLFNLLNVLGEYKVRVSSSQKNLHIISEDLNDTDLWFLREIYDDEMRIKADLLRKKYGMMDNILFSKKGDKKSGDWITIKSESDIINFILDFFNLQY